MIQSLSNDFDPIKDFIKSVISFINWAYNIIDKIFGLIGIILLSPLFAVVTFFLWLALVYSNKGFKKSMSKLFNSIGNNSDHRQLMIIHRNFKKQRIETDKVIKRSPSGSKFFLFRPLYSQINVSRNLFLEAEERLYKTIYPHLYQELSNDQKKQLIEFSKNFEGVFDHELN